MFRDKFWLTFALTIPVVLLSHDIQEWFGYTVPAFPGQQYAAAILGTIVFLYGGLVFLRRARGELAERQPGMMALISLAIVVAFVTSWGIDLTMAVGAIAMSISTIVVAANAQLLRRLRLRRALPASRPVPVAA